MKYQYKNFLQLMLLRLVRLQKDSQEEAGFVLVIVISMVLILTSLLAAYALLSKVETASTKSSISSNTGFYTAEAGLNLRAKQIQEKFIDFNRPSGTPPGTSPNYSDALQKCIDNATGHLGTNDFICSRQTFNNQTLLSFVQEDPNNNRNPPTTIQINPGELYAGLNAQEYSYDVTSVALNSQKLPNAMLGMRFKSRVVPMFQFAVFYDKDLEISPGALMTLNGRVHTNGDLYLNSGNTLTINGQISTMGGLYRGRKDDRACNGTVNIHNPGTASPLGCSGSTITTYNQAGVASWNKMINIGVDKITVPPTDSFDASPGKTYWDKADLRIVLALDNLGNPTGVEVRNQDDSVNTTATNTLRFSCSPLTTTTTSAYTAAATNLNVASSGGFAIGDIVTIGDGTTTDYENNVISAVPSTTRITLARALGTTQPTSASVRKAIVSTSNTFFNNREKRGTPATTGTFIRMLEVDAQNLLNCAQSQNTALMGGLLLNETSDGGLAWFLTVDGTNSNAINNYGVRIRNGSQLASTIAGAPTIAGLTIISDQAIYVRGDYNSINKRPAAVMADTVNILSNGWIMNDSASTLGLSNRVPTATTINAAILAATDSTGGKEGVVGQGGGSSTYNGGLENYPRLHETWSAGGGVTLTYRGSFVSLGTPRRVNGPWCGTGGGCNIYDAPRRDWNYDTDFNNAANLPPLSPRFVYLRQEVFSRDFEQ